jgi:hypothetical protein
LSKKWLASLQARFHDGCGVPVSNGGWLPPNGSPGGCRDGAPVGVHPATNRAGDGAVTDRSSSPVIAPDGSILFGSYSRYNYAQGHLMRFDSNGNYLGAFGFGWDIRPAIYSQNGSWSIVLKNNHYTVGSVLRRRHLMSAGPHFNESPFTGTIFRKPDQSRLHQPMELSEHEYPKLYTKP